LFIQALPLSRRICMEHHTRAGILQSIMRNSPDYLVRVGCGDDTNTTYPVYLSTAFSLTADRAGLSATPISGGNHRRRHCRCGGDATAVVWAPDGAAPAYSTDNGNSRQPSALSRQRRLSVQTARKPSKFYRIRRYCICKHRQRENLFGKGNGPDICGLS